MSHAVQVSGEVRSSPYVKVAVARPMVGELTYAVPATFPPLCLGHVVLVPLGRLGETGYVIRQLEEPDFDPAKIKPVSRLLDPKPAFDEAQLEFLRWVANYYLCPLGMVIQTALPAGIRAKTLLTFVPTEHGVAALTRSEIAGADLQVLREAISRPGLTRRGLQRKLSEELDSKEADRAMDRLVRGGLAEWIEREVGEVRGRQKHVVRTEAARPEKLGARMAAILEHLESAGGSVELSGLLTEHGSAGRSSVNRLKEKGLVEIEERERRDVLADAPAVGASEPPPLNADQTTALEQLRDPEATGAYLLFGVTGSGKTEVFLGAAQTVLDRGQQVLVLVPEIGLTPQLVGRFGPASATGSPCCTRASPAPSDWPNGGGSGLARPMSRWARGLHCLPRSRTSGSSWSTRSTTTPTSKRRACPTMHATSR